MKKLLLFFFITPRFLLKTAGAEFPCILLTKYLTLTLQQNLNHRGQGLDCICQRRLLRNIFLGKLSVHNTKNGACFEIRLNRVENRRRKKNQEES